LDPQVVSALVLVMSTYMCVFHVPVLRKYVCRGEKSRFLN
jgi:hypothetical protein